MDLENSEFLKFVESANKSGLEFIIIGGLALNLNGIFRHTADADIWIRPTNQNKKLFLQTLLDIGYIEGEIAEIGEQDFTQPQVITIAGPIDVLTVVHHRSDFDTCFKRAIVQEIQKNSIHVFHLNDLREAKVLARRHQDLRDIILIDDFLKGENPKLKEENIWQRMQFWKKR